MAKKKKNTLDLDEIPWDGQCIMLDGREKVPMTRSEAQRRAEERRLYYYQCKYCKMWHFSAEKGPRSGK